MRDRKPDGQTTEKPPKEEIKEETKKQLTWEETVMEGEEALVKEIEEEW